MSAATARKLAGAERPWTSVQVVLPALMQLLVPPLRPVAANLQTPEERATLATLTDTMLAYNLRYDAAAGGLPPAAGLPSAAMAATPLLPAVDVLCHFEVGLRHQQSCRRAAFHMP